MKAIIVRGLIGLLSLYILLFWIFILGWSDILYNSPDREWWGVKYLLGFLFSFFALWAGTKHGLIEVVFGAKRVKYAALGSMAVATVIYFARGRIYHEDVIMAVAFPVIVGAVASMGVLGLMYALQFGLLKTEGS